MSDGSTVHHLLTRLLQDAHAGELAAAYAYRGHWKSLRRRHPEESAEIHRIEEAEWHHRRGLARILGELGEKPRRPREQLMGAIGRFFGSLCWIGGWFGPMYAAGRLEAMNVGQYDDAVAYCRELGLDQYIDELSAMRTEEDRHERFFGDQIRNHFLLRPTARVLGWSPPDPV